MVTVEIAILSSTNTLMIIRISAMMIVILIVRASAIICALLGQNPLSLSFESAVTWACHSYPTPSSLVSMLLIYFLILLIAFFHLNSIHFPSSCGSSIPRSYQCCPIIRFSFSFTYTSPAIERHMHQYACTVLDVRSFCFAFDLLFFASVMLNEYENGDVLHRDPSDDIYHSHLGLFTVTSHRARQI